MINPLAEAKSSIYSLVFTPWTWSSWGSKTFKAVREKQGSEGSPSSGSSLFGSQWSRGNAQQTWVKVPLLFKNCFYLFLAVLGLLSLCRLFSSFREGGPLSSLVCGLLTAMASLVVEQRPQVHRLQWARPPVLVSTGSGVVGHRLCCSHMWHLPRPGIKLTSLVLAGRFFTTEPWGKPSPPLLGIAPFLVPDWLLYEKPLPGIIIIFFFSSWGNTCCPVGSACSRGPKCGHRNISSLKWSIWDLPSWEKTIAFQWHAEGCWVLAQVGQALWVLGHYSFLRVVITCKGSMG